MSLKIKIVGEEKEFSAVNRKQDEEDNVIFELTSLSSKGEYRFPTAFSNIDIRNTAKVFIFKNKHFETRDIIQFRIEKENAIRSNGKPSPDGHIGYFFSLQLLKEDVPTIKQILKDASNSNPKILSAINTYLLFAVEVILKNEQGKVSLAPKVLSNNDIEDPGNLTINDLYSGEDIVILCINEESLKYSDQFSIDTYLCDLYKYGFYLFTKHGTKIRYNELPIINKNYNDSKTKHIKVTQTSDTIDFQTPNSFYQTLLYELIQQDSKFPTSFIIFYQVIELLKDKVLKNEIKYLPNDNDSKSGYDIRKAVYKKMDKLNSDAALVKRLFSSDYSNIDEDNKGFLRGKIETFIKESETSNEEKVKTELTELQDLLKHFSANKGDEFYDTISMEIKGIQQKVVKENFAPMLYQLRNIIVHNYSVIFEKKIDESLINNIRMSFEYLIIDLLHTYKDKTTE